MLERSSDFISNHIMHFFGSYLSLSTFGKILNPGNQRDYFRNDFIRALDREKMRELWYCRPRNELIFGLSWDYDNLVSWLSSLMEAEHANCTFSLLAQIFYLPRWEGGRVVGREVRGREEHFWHSAELCHIFRCSSPILFPALPYRREQLYLDRIIGSKNKINKE